MYETIGVAYHSEDNKPLVIYKSLADGRLWARPVDMWVDIIDGEHPRFKMISTLENYEKAKHNK